MKFNNVASKAVATTGVLAFAMALSSGTVVAGEKKGKKEKCYGIVAKGMNDCATSSHSCAGQAKVDNHPEEWVYMPAGLCKRVAGSKDKPAKT